MLQVFIQFSFVIKSSCQYSRDNKKLLGFPWPWTLIQLERNGFQVLMIIFHLFQILNEKAMEYTDVLNARLNKVQQDFDQQLLSIDRLATENTQKAAELKAKEDEINGLRQETMYQSVMAEAIQRKLRAVEYHKIEVERREETLRRQVSGLEKGKWNDGMKRDCLSFLKLDRSKTCLAFPFLSS